VKALPERQTGRVFKDKEDDDRDAIEKVRQTHQYRLHVLCMRRVTRIMTNGEEAAQDEG